MMVEDRQEFHAFQKKNHSMSFIFFRIIFKVKKDASHPKPTPFSVRSLYDKLASRLLCSTLVHMVTQNVRTNQILRL